MREILMTRKDADVGDGIFDSVKWIFETHLKEPDCLEINSAVFYGWNEDYPERIDFYREPCPLITSVPCRVWTRPESEQ